MKCMYFKIFYDFVFYLFFTIVSIPCVLVLKVWDRIQKMRGN